MNDKDNSHTAWPLPKFYFEVNWNGQLMSFQEVSGLDVGEQVVEYRAGDRAQFSTIGMPGTRKSGSITMKKGKFESDAKFREWFDQLKMNTIQRHPLTISLLDESGSTTMSWTLEKAWPLNVTSNHLDADSDEIAIESLKVIHEGISISQL